MKPFCLVLLLALSLPACSSFSKSARQQRAYGKYVQKQMSMRSRQQSRISRNRAAQIPSGETGPVNATMTAEGPQAVSQEQTGQ